MENVNPGLAPFVGEDGKIVVSDNMPENLKNAINFLNDNNVGLFDKLPEEEPHYADDDDDSDDSDDSDDIDDLDEEEEDLDDSDDLDEDGDSSNLNDLNNLF